MPIHHRRRDSARMSHVVRDARQAAERHVVWDEHVGQLTPAGQVVPRNALGTWVRLPLVALGQINDLADIRPPGLGFVEENGTHRGDRSAGRASTGSQTDGYIVQS